MLVPQGTVVSPLYMEGMVPQGSVISPLYMEKMLVPQGSVFSPLYEKQSMPQGSMVSPLNVGVPQGTFIRPLYAERECVLGVPQGTLMRPMSPKEGIFPHNIEVPISSTISPLCTVGVPQGTIGTRRNERTGIPREWSIGSLLTERKYMPRKMEETQGDVLSPLLVGPVSQGGVFTSLHVKGVPQGTMIRPISAGRNEKEILIHPPPTFRPSYTEERVVPQGFKISPIQYLIEVPQMRPLSTKGVPVGTISPHHIDRREISQGVFSLPPYTEENVALKTITSSLDTQRESELAAIRVNNPFHFERKEMPQEVKNSEGLKLPDSEGREVPQGCALGPLHSEIELSKGFIMNPLYQTLGLPQEGTFSPIYTERRSLLGEKIVSPHQNQRTETNQGSPLRSVSKGVLSPKENRRRCDKTDIYQENVFSPPVVVSSQQTKESKRKVEKGNEQSPLLYVSKQQSSENVEPHRDNELSPPLITSSRNAQGISSDLFQGNMLNPFHFVASPQSSTDSGKLREKAAPKISSISAYSMGYNTLASSLSKLDIQSPILPRRSVNNEGTSEKKETNAENQQEDKNGTKKNVAE